MFLELLKTGTSVVVTNMFSLKKKTVFLSCIRKCFEALNNFTLLIYTITFHFKNSSDIPNKKQL